MHRASRQDCRIAGTLVADDRRRTVFANQAVFQRRADDVDEDFGGTRMIVRRNHTARLQNGGREPLERTKVKM